MIECLGKLFEEGGWFESSFYCFCCLFGSCFLFKFEIFIIIFLLCNEIVWVCKVVCKKGINFFVIKVY